MLNIKWIHFKILDSTILTAKQEISRFDKEEITLITAGEQRAGQGRWKSTWYSPPGVNIYATYCFVLEPNCPFIGNLAQQLAVSAATVLEKYKISPVIKWPNDLLVKDKKIAGVVCELVSQENQLWAINSIGLNVNFDQSHPQRTSIAIETGRVQDLEEVLTFLNRQFQNDLEHLFQSGFAALLPHLRHYTEPFVGKPVRFRGDPSDWEGLFHSLNEDGSLNLQLSDGSIKQFFSGEQWISTQ